MICRDELKRLQGHNDYPSLSILAPTHRTAPANKKDRIVIKNLAAKGLERLNAEFKKREVAKMTRDLERLIDRIDHEHLQDGLALFVGGNVATTVHLPFRPRPRVVIDATFATRDLVYALNKAPRYRVLVLTEKPTRLYEAMTNVLTEHTEKPFPMTHTGAGGAAKLPGGPGVNRSAVRDDGHRQFFRKVDDALAVIQKADPLPLVVVGIERYLAFFQEVTKRPDDIVGVVAGSHDDPNPASLGKLVWPVFKAGSTLGRSRALARLNQAVGANRSASGIDQVWRAAVASQVQTLLVETDFKYPADLAPEGDHLLPYTGKGATALDDAVDEVIEKVIASGGDVRFYDPDLLDVHQKIAAVLRPGTGGR
jgi:hypothetical protein